MPEGTNEVETSPQPTLTRYDARRLEIDDIVATERQRAHPEPGEGPAEVDETDYQATRLIGVFAHAMNDTAQTLDRILAKLEGR